MTAEATLLIRAASGVVFLGVGLILRWPAEELAPVRVVRTKPWCRPNRVTEAT